MDKITIIMPFLNEGMEPITTLLNIFSTAPAELFNVIVINDGGVDLPEYRTCFSVYPNVLYIIHARAKGVAYCRTVYTDMVSTKYILLIDAHMRFKDDMWMQTIIANLESHPENTLFCTKTITLTEDDKDVNRDWPDFALGANIIYDPNKPEILWPTWRPWDPDRIKYPTEHIPCVLGANYAIHTSYFKYLHGVDGLMEYGVDEEFMSLKSWMMGGSVMLMTNVAIAHIFRVNRDGSPVTVPYMKHEPEYMLYNRMYMIYVLFPEITKNQIFDLIKNSRPESYRIVQARIESNQYAIDLEREYIQSRSKFTIHEVFQKIGVYA